MGNRMSEHEAAPPSRRATGLDPAMGIHDFELLSVVGKGAFGKVLQVRKRDTGVIYAMKVLNKQHLVKRAQVEHTQSERNILEDIEHPFIVSLRFAFQTPTKLYMVLDYFNGGELFHHLTKEGRFSVDRTVFYAAQIVLALECLHQHKIVYRDLKPENILVTASGYLKLTDFGLSKQDVSGTTLTHTFCGTPEYLSPETVQKVGYNQMVDWWSLGALVFEMLSGTPPFYSENINVMYDNILYAAVKFPKYFTPESISLIKGLLDRDPDQRLGAQGAEEIKQHPFFQDMDWEALVQMEIPPSFIPSIIDGDADVHNIDQEFKNMAAKDTPAPRSQLDELRFSNFTYDDTRGLARVTEEEAPDDIFN